MSANSKNQYKMPNGLQDSILGQKLMIMTEKGEFVQILHIGSYHSFVVNNKNCTKNEINYYNSMFYKKIKDHVKMQICKMCKFFQEELSVNV